MGVGGWGRIYYQSLIAKQIENCETISEGIPESTAYLSIWSHVLARLFVDPFQMDIIEPDVLSIISSPDNVHNPRTSEDKYRQICRLIAAH